MGLAMACLGLDAEAFFDLTARAFQAAMMAYNRRMRDEYRLAAENARLTGWLAARPGMSDQSQRMYNHPQKYWPFAWEESPQVSNEKPTEENMDKARMWLNE